MKNYILFLGVLLGIILLSLTTSYTAPTYDDIDFDLCTGYTAPTYNDINFTLGLSDSCSTDSCTYTSGDWVVNCSDNCSITTDVDLALNDIIFTDAGHFEVQANITNIGKREVSNGCQVWVYNNSKF